MKIKIFIHLFLFSFLALIEPVVSNNKFKKNNNFEYSKIKAIKLDENLYQDHVLKNSEIDKSLYKGKFNIHANLNYFFYDLLANLDNNSLEINKELSLDNIDYDNDSLKINKKLPSVYIDSDEQTALGSLIIAEGNVVVKSQNAILNASKLSYDKDLKLLIIRGNIKFTYEDSFLEASDIEYDFINKKGFILNAYGSVNFKEISKIQLFSKDNSNRIEDNILKYENNPKEVRFNNESFLKLGNFYRKYEEDESFTDQDFEAKFNPIVKTRFTTKKIDINDNVWFSDDLTLTNDPFNKPQLKIRNKNFRTIFNEDNTKIRSKWSWARVEDKISVPLGPRRIDVDKNQNFKWGNGYDKEKYDGFYIFRRFNEINFNDNTSLNLTTTFPIQRIIYGETESFPKNEDLVISPKVKQDIKFTDYFGIGAFLKSEKNNWQYILDISTNSLDVEKLDKATEINSYLKINLSQDEINSKEKKSTNGNLPQPNFNLNKSDDLTFFGSYRSKTKNGSLGEIVVKSSYGVQYDITTNKESNNIKSFTDKSLSIGNYESESKLNSNNLINKNRLLLSFKRGYEIPLWKPETETYINDEYKYSPVVIPQGLSWNLEGNLDFFRYEDGSKQDLFLIKTGPKLTVGELKKNLFDYTEISIMPRFKFNRGQSPFNFDQVIDNKAIELKVSQQLYGPILVNFTTELSLDKKESNEDILINPVIDIAWSRRAYSVNLFYNLDSEVGGINFKINTFDFKGAGERFN